MDLYRKTKKIPKEERYGLTSQIRRIWQKDNSRLLEVIIYFLWFCLRVGDPGLTKRLKITEVKGKHLIAKYSIHDLDDLLGFIAAEANQTEDKKLKKKLDKLFDKLSRILDTEYGE